MFVVSLYNTTNSRHPNQGTPKAKLRVLYQLVGNDRYMHHLEECQRFRS